jgi:two-component system NtrC family sensor kinase
MLFALLGLAAGAPPGYAPHGLGLCGGMLCELLAMGVQVLEQNLHLALPEQVSYVLQVAMVVAPALSISLYLVREFALDSELLQVKLREVKRLSAQALA